MKKLILLCAVLCIGQLYGMSETDDFTLYFKELSKKGVLPKELQNDIRRLQLLKNFVVCFSNLDLLDTVHVQGPGYISIIKSVAINGNKLVAGSNDGNVTLWDISNGEFKLLDKRGPEKLSKYGSGDRDINSVAIDGNKVIAGLEDGTVELYNISNDQFELITSTRSPYNEVHSVAISGNRVLAGLHDKTAELLDISNNQFALIATTPKKSQGGHSDSISSVAISGNKVVTGSWDKTAKLWDISNNQFVLIATTPKKSQGGHSDSINSIAISGNKVVTGSSSSDMTAKLWDISNGQFKLLATTPKTENGEYFYDINSVAINGNRVATGSERAYSEGDIDSTLKIWDISQDQFKLIAVSYGESDERGIRSVGMNGNIIVTGSDKNMLRLWRLSLDLTGTPQDNPLVWIIQKATVPQLDLINRANDAAIVQKTFSLDIQDLHLFLSFPKHVQEYLVERLNIELEE